jgi:hypothetical protein
LLDVVGNAANELPSQIGATGVKRGSMFGLTVMVKLAGITQAPEVAVNV